MQKGKKSQKKKNPPPSSLTSPSCPLPPTSKKSISANPAQSAVMLMCLTEELAAHGCSNEGAGRTEAGLGEKERKTEPIRRSKTSTQHSGQQLEPVNLMRKSSGGTIQWPTSSLAPKPPWHLFSLQPPDSVTTRQRFYF